MLTLETGARNQGPLVKKIREGSTAQTASFISNLVTYFVQALTSNAAETTEIIYNPHPP